MIFDISHLDVLDVIERALEEDIGPGDITSELTVPPTLKALGSFVVKEDLVLAGIELLPLIYGSDSDTNLEFFEHSGSCARPGDIVAVVRANARFLLGRERVALNFLQRLSGIATLARKHVDAVAGTGVEVLDTRKTTPGLRKLEKMAAAAGGVTNHRYGLFDAVLIKNNHIAAAGGVREALERAKDFRGPIEIEVRTQAELETALDAGAKHLLLDNLSPLQAAEWIHYIDGSATVELSGGICLENIRAYAETGPDFISCGAITHSAPAVDISFHLELEQHKCD